MLLACPFVQVPALILNIIMSKRGIMTDLNGTTKLSSFSHWILFSPPAQEKRRKTIRSNSFLSIFFPPSQRCEFVKGHGHLLSLYGRVGLPESEERAIIFQTPPELKGDTRKKGREKDLLTVASGLLSSSFFSRSVYMFGIYPDRNIG